MTKSRRSRRRSRTSKKPASRRKERRRSSALRALDNVVSRLEKPSLTDSEGVGVTTFAVSVGISGKEYKNIFELLISLPSPDENALKNVCISVQTLLKQTNVIHENLYPAEQYVKDQISLFLLSILRGVKVRSITCGLLREGIENLYYMAVYMSSVDGAIAAMAGLDICNIILILESILNHAERLVGVTQVNYQRVREYMAVMFPGYANVDRSFSYGKAKYFRIEKLLGAGGFGAVFQAYVGGIECAMKHVPLRLLPDPENATVDKKVASLINHTCLVNYLACFCTRESYVTVMEFIRGVDVIKLLRKCVTLPNELVKIVIAQLGLALQHMHYKGFVHRDVKPANIMISRGCRVKLFDFDTAKVSYGKHHQKYMFYFSRKTPGEFKDGEIAGTIAYMAPEVFQKESYGRAADWYSVGITAFELASGKLPFKVEGKTFSAQKETILRGDYSWPKDHEDFVLQLFVDYCMRPKKHRLCSKRYLEFLYHPYFDDVSWETIENGQPLMDFEPLNQMIAAQFEDSQLQYTTTASSDQSERCSVDSVLKRVESLFDAMRPEFHEDTSQKPMFVYSSVEFRRLIESVDKMLPANLENIRRAPERVYTTETKEDYEFEYT